MLVPSTTTPRFASHAGQLANGLALAKSRAAGESVAARARRLRRGSLDAIVRDELTETMRLCGLSQQDVADAAGVDRKTIARGLDDSKPIRAAYLRGLPAHVREVLHALGMIGAATALEPDRVVQRCFELCVAVGQCASEAREGNRSGFDRALGALASFSLMQARAVRQ